MTDYITNVDYITNEDTIIFGPSFNQELNPTLLTNYKQIIFSDYKLDPNLFDFYEKIHTYNYYERYKNNTIFFVLTDSGSKFDIPVSNIPTSITHITFGSNFDQPVNLLPTSITHLIFGDYFNQLVESLPSSITHLTFGWLFNQQVDLLPPSIQNLTFNVSFNMPLNNLPSNLEFIHLSYKYDKQILNIPPKLKKIKCFLGYKYINDLNDLTGLKVITY